MKCPEADADADASTHSEPIERSATSYEHLLRVFQTQLGHRGVTMMQDSLNAMLAEQCAPPYLLAAQRPDGVGGWIVIGQGCKALLWNLS